MNHDKDEPIDINDLNKIFRMMQEEFKRMLNNQFNQDCNDNVRSFVKGFSVHIGPDGVPHFESIDNMPPEMLANIPDLFQKDVNSTLTFTRAGWEQPYTEVHENEDEGYYQIVAEVPGIEKIHLEINGRDLLLQGELGNRKYRKQILLKHELDPKSVQWAIRNGVLEILVNFAKK